MALIATPAAHASTNYGPSMSAAEIRDMQSQGIQEIIVERQPGVSSAQQDALRAQAGVSYVGPGPLANTELDRAPAGGLSAAVAALERDPQVQYAEPNGQVHGAGVPNDTYFGQQWALANSGQAVGNAGGTTRGTAGDDIGATYAWAAHSTGAGVTVAVVDTGVDASAPDLQTQLTTGWDFITGTNVPQDPNGHGTHVSGIIAAAQNNSTGVSGVAPNATMMPLRVLDASGKGTLDAVAAAFNYAGDHNVPIVNASLGGSAPSTTLEQALAQHPNTLYVVAAGNDGANDDATPFYPCDLPEANLICVGASDQNDQPAAFSNYGARSVDLFAPGVNILSTYPGGYAFADGTSMATPMVTGTLALMLQRAPSLTGAQLKSALLASVDVAPQLAGLAGTGGELDAAAAVATAGGDSAYAAPANRARPLVLGPGTVGQLLSANPGSWSRLPTSYTYQWQRCLLGVCLPIPGATNSTYAPGASELGASFEVLVGASNAAGAAQAMSTATAAIRQPGSTAPAGGSTTPPARAPQHSPVRRRAISLTRVALLTHRPARTQVLVFTLSARARVQISLSAASRRGGAAGDVLRLALSGHRGGNRYSLASLLHGRRLPRGHYVLTVRAGRRAVTLRLNLV